MGNRFPLSSKQPLPELSLSRGTVEDLANTPFFVIWWGFVPLPQVNAIKWGCRGMTESPHNKTDLVWAVTAAGAPSSWGRCRWGAEQHPQAPQVTLSPCVIGSADKQLLRGEIGPTFNWCPCCLEQRAKESCCWAPGCPLSVSWGCLLSGCNSLQEFPRTATTGCPQPARCPGLTGVLGRRKERLGITGNCGNRLSPQSRLQLGPAGHEVPLSPAWSQHGAPGSSTVRRKLPDSSRHAPGYVLPAETASGSHGANPKFMPALPIIYSALCAQTALSVMLDNEIISGFALA